uniref:Leukocyte cell-derived chemotaxin 1 n=1 Tax=Denticeps clupeoides TaxID=299321 RepID=A0AAY4ASE4_9TELE
MGRWRKARWRSTREITWSGSGPGAETTRPWRSTTSTLYVKVLNDDQRTTIVAVSIRSTRLAAFRSFKSVVCLLVLRLFTSHLYVKNTSISHKTNTFMHRRPFSQQGITAIRFSGGEKCYIKTQAKGHLPEIDGLNKDSLTFDLEDEIMPAKFEEESLIWVASEQPLKDNSFLSAKILDLCGDLPIFWLRPIYPNGGQKKKRAVPRARRQATRPRNEEEETPFNPENPYHRGLEGEEGTMTFDPMLDHQGICCTECRRSYTQCQRICEPLGGYEPWPYHYQGCRVACRVIMPCNWWVARILGLV